MIDIINLDCLRVEVVCTHFHSMSQTKNDHYCRGQYKKKDSAVAADAFHCIYYENGRKKKRIESAWYACEWFERRCTSLKL